MSKFGYLNENNPAVIGDNEAQEMVNCRIDKGYLEFGKFLINEDEPAPGRQINLPGGYEVKIDGEIYDFSNVVWRRSLLTGWRRIGIKKPGTVQVPLPTITKQTDPGTNDFAPEVGRHFYAITLYDSDTYEESPAVLIEAEFTEYDQTENHKFKFTDFTSLASVYPDRPNLKWRIYRMPFGGDEYLLSLVKAATSDTEVYDATPDNYLDIMCETLANVDIPADALHGSALYFADKLWLGTAFTPAGSMKASGIVYFSKTGVWDQFPARNFISLPDPVTGLTTYGEAVLIQTTTKSYIVYGDDTDSFLVRPVDYEFSGIANNTCWAANGMAFMLAMKKTDVGHFKPQSVVGVSGRTAVEISFKVFKTLHERFLFTQGGPGVKSAMLSNRFYVVELYQQEGEYPSVSYVNPINLVYDSYTRGFCLSDANSESFAYRTKEFTFPGKRDAQFYKRLFVRGKGSFTVEVLGDSKVVTARSFTLSDLDTVYFTVKPRRFKSLSIRFSGVEGAEIHDWGESK